MIFPTLFMSIGMTTQTHYNCGAAKKWHNEHNWSDIITQRKQIKGKQCLMSPRILLVIGQISIKNTLMHIKTCKNVLQIMQKHYWKWRLDIWAKLQHAAFHILRHFYGTFYDTFMAHFMAVLVTSPCSKRTKTRCL